MRKKETTEVDLKPRWNFIAKFYLVCIILFVIFVAYIVIYRYTHWDEVQNNIENSNNNTKVEEENTIENEIKNPIDEEEPVSDTQTTDTINETASQSTQEKKVQGTSSVTTQTTQTQVSTSKPSTTTSQSTQSQSQTQTQIQTQPQTPSESTATPKQVTTSKRNEESFKVNNTIINQMKNIINSNQSSYMKQFGYNIVVDSSIVNQSTGFTYTETRVKNAIANSFGTIRIYARDYYIGNELRWTESFIL